MDPAQFKLLVGKIDRLLRLQTIETLKGIATERDKIQFLDNLDFSPIEIDKLLGKNSGYASVVLSQIKKKKSAKPPEQPPVILASKSLEATA